MIIIFDWLGKIISELFSGAFDTLSSSISAMIWDVMLQWVYNAIYDAIADFFTMMGKLGVEIFDLPWVAAAVKLFSLFGWALFAVGMVVAIFDVAIESQSGRVNIKTTSLNIIKGFMAAGMFTTVPVELYKFCITLQNTFAGDLTRVFTGQQSKTLSQASIAALAGNFSTGGQSGNILKIISMIALVYCVAKIFFANIKRGGILLIQLSVGALYLFSVPRGYNDGFIQWCKQIVALCLTAFMQTTLLFMGLMTFSTNMLLGLGIMLSATEVPRIAQQFGLDTTIKMSAMNIVNTTSTVMNLTRNAAKVAAK